MQYSQGIVSSFAFHLGVCLFAVTVAYDNCGQVNKMSCGPEDHYQCYTGSKRCDGFWDCPNSGSDEAGCRGCHRNSYSCNDFAHESANCYPKHDRCNGASACANYADERNCNKQQCSESRNLFLCANKRCISYDLVCDESDDCGDHSDEADCRQGLSRKVIIVAVVGSLLLLLSVSCVYRMYTMYKNDDAEPHQCNDTPLSLLQAELFRRRAPPPPYQMAMLTSRPYDEVVREYLAQIQQSEPAERESRRAEEGGSGDSSVQNLISLMDVLEEGGVPHQPPGENSEHLESDTVEDTSSDSDSAANGAWLESDADSVCFLCLDDDPAAPDDGSDTRCLVQDA